MFSQNTLCQKLHRYVTKKKISQLKKKYQHKKNHHRLILTCFGIKNGISRKTYSMIIELEIRVEISYRNFSRSN